MANSDRPLAGFGALAGLAVVLTASTVSAQEGAVSAGMMVRAVSGTFGAETRSHLVYAPAILRVDMGRLELGGYLPYLTLDQGTVALSQGGFVPMQGT